MAASVTDLIDRVTDSTTGRPVISSLAAPGKAMAASSINISDATNWTTTTGVHFSIYQTQVVGGVTVKNPTTQTDWKGTLSGTTISNLTITGGTDRAYVAGDIVELTPTARYAKDLYELIIAFANQDGSLKAAPIQTALGLGAGSLNGWNALGYTPNTVTASGNGYYSLVFNSVDLTSIVSPGTRLRTTRTVAAPNQCTSLNGTTQYYSKSSPAGMTFTDDFTVSAWIKLTSYGSSTVIASRYNGTSGWRFTLNSIGQITLEGYNAGSGNISYVSSYQSVPLNKWVHVAAQLDMSAFTTTTITSYVMINGLDTPAFVTRVGTNPTAFIQAGNLEIGSNNGGANFFPGKIAQLAIYSAKVTQATILASMNQTLAGTETSLVSAYSFNNTINDLNTTSANNLTANGSAVATSADSPYGAQGDGTISTTLDYCVVRGATFSTNTTIVVQATDGNTIPTSGGITAVVYSTQAFPYGIPAPSKILGYAQVSNYVSSSSAVDVDVSGLTATVYVPAGSTLEIQARTLIYSTAAGDSGRITLYEDGNAVESFSRIADGNNYYDYISYEFTRFPTAGSHTYKIMAQRAGGTGAMRFGGDLATEVGSIKVKLAA
jgi:hypothetical protein